MSKGRLTRDNILQTAFEQASQQGLESLTIGSLASACEMSKSGLFAHFQSRDNLQIAVLEYAAEVFRERVIQPVRQQQHGSQRAKLTALLQAWLAWNQCFAYRCMFLDAWTSAQEGRCSRPPASWCASGSTTWPVRWCRDRARASGAATWIPARRLSPLWPLSGGSGVQCPRSVSGSGPPLLARSGVVAGWLVLMD